MAYWLFKTEPETYSFDQLKKDKKTNWNNVRNFQARNSLREAAIGDLALIYHSGDSKEIVGVARVVKAAYPDLDPEMAGEWVQIDIGYVSHFDKPVTLSELKKTKALADLKLIKQSRLSCMPVTKAHFDLIMKMGSAK
ncbi:MAG: EVE domain-containing protein [Xanthomonadaceae bacterium]|nr:EVE domain-containing protein [Xanthomonadaceae bacterium]